MSRQKALCLIEIRVFSLIDEITEKKQAYFLKRGFRKHSKVYFLSLKER